MNNSDKSIYLKRYQELTRLCEEFKELYKTLEARYAICSCFPCKMRLVTLGMEIVGLNSRIEQMERELLPPLEDILTSMTISYTVEEGQIKLVDE